MVVKQSSAADTYYLVSCVGQKATVPSKAKDLYISNWFKKVRAHIERCSGKWLILSAEHGLLHPEVLVAPYEKTLNRMSTDERRHWARTVIRQMERDLPECNDIVVFAGARYREFLMNYLATRAHRIVVPLEGLRIGEQLNWLASHSPK